MSDSYRVAEISGSDPQIERYMGIILGNWLTTLRFTNDWFKLIDEEVYYTVYPKVIRAILSRPECKVSLALSSDDDDLCYGWAVYESKTIHYVYVKRDGRGQGIAASLVPADFNTLTHLTVPGTVIWKTKFSHAKFNPFI